MESKQNWISVEECLPKECQRILYRARYDGVHTGLEQEEIELEIFYNFKFQWLEEYNNKRLNNYRITHWLPIPPTYGLSDKTVTEKKETQPSHKVFKPFDKVIYRTGRLLPWRTALYDQYRTISLGQEDGEAQYHRLQNRCSVTDDNILPYEGYESWVGTYNEIDTGK